MLFNLTLEYMDKPLLPAPFVIINHIIMLGKRVFVYLKNPSESESQDMAVRRKKRKTNKIGLRPVKIHLLTMEEYYKLGSIS